MLKAEGQVLHMLNSVPFGQCVIGGVAVTGCAPSFPVSLLRKISHIVSGQSRQTVGPAF